MLGNNTVIYRIFQDQKKSRQTKTIKTAKHNN